MKNISRYISAFTVLALFGAGCGSTPASPAPSPSPTPEAARPAENSMAGCFNLYYPLKAGTEIQYVMKGSGTDVPMAIRVIERDADSVKLEYVFTVQGREATVSNELVCENGTIRGKGHFDMAQALTGMNISYETISMEGEILPSDLALGREWNLATEVEIHTTEAQFKAMLDGRRQKTNIASKVVAEEQVTVPAGTFTALKIEQTITAESAMAPGVQSSVTATAWYVKDIGLIKSESAAAGTVSTMEAVRIVN